MKIGDRIAARRKELGMSQTELAKKMGYKSKAAISKIETNVNDITQSTIIKFAEALDTSVVYLMGWEEPAPSPSAESIALQKQHEEINAIFDSLPPEYRARFLDFLRSTAQLAQSQDAGGESD